MFRTLGRFFTDLLNAVLDDVAPLANGNPVSSAASALSKEGHRQRRETFAEKQAVLHERLRGAVQSQKVMG